MLFRQFPEIGEADHADRLKRIVNEESLREKIPYWLIRWLPHVHALAHGEANLCQPLRTIASHADYWSNEKNYQRIPQPYIPSQNVEVSSRRNCRKCKGDGIVQICTHCKKFYHPRACCHDFINCANTVQNPYA